MDNTIFEERLNKLLREKKLSMREVARQTGISHTSIAVYALGQVMPRLENLEKIAKALDVTPEYLLGAGESKCATDDILIKGETLGSRISGLLYQREMTQRDLARSVGVSDTVMSMYVHGYRLPQKDMVVAMAMVLHVTPDYLLGITSEAD